ncbi:hypothetical protein HMPREF1982_01076 [Clostridiales bacterium oral taxon 876 str. F0540]|nr:hypothetical protein HMPREF1982_01076 [Clostridiales bacterium oral taxon 876 str. F0540]
MVNLKNMSRKERFQYIWDYYKFHIIGILAAIIIISSIIYGQVTKVNYVFNLTLIGNDIDQNKKAELERQITDIVVNNGSKRNQAIVDVIPVGDSNSSNNIMSGQLMQKFMTELSVQTVDIAVMDKGVFDSLVKNDAFLKLDNISDFDLSSIKDEKIKEEGSDGKKAVYGISAENIKVLNDMGFNPKDKVICIISSSKHVDKAVYVLKWVLK